MLARVAAFVIWALVAATVVFWGMRLLVRPLAAPAYAVGVGEAGVLRGDLSRLLGATPVVAAATTVAPAPELAARFKLIGLVAGRTAQDPGLALIAVDSKPARAYPVGASLDGDLVLQSVSLRSASIGPAQGQAAVTLEIPALPMAATGSLPVGGSTIGGPVPGSAAAPPIPPPPPGPVISGRPLSGAAAAAIPPPPPTTRRQSPNSR
jgi:general secretion pathway protein C